MTKEAWREYLGDAKFSELRHAAENTTLLEAIEDVMCHEVKNDNTAIPGRPANSEGNFFFAYIEKLGTSVDNEKLGEQLRGYYV